MADAGLLDVVTKAVTDLATALNDPATIEGLKGFAGLLADIATSAVAAASALGSFYNKATSAIEKAGDSAFAGIFGEEGAKSIALARKAKANGLSMDSQKAVDDYMAKGGFKFGGGDADTAGLSSEGAFVGGKSSPVSAAYTLGKSSGPVVSDKAAKAKQKAQDESARMREQLAGQVQNMRYGFADPQEQAAMDVEKQQKLLKEALDVKAITEQEYRDLSLEAEMEYQDQLKEIRDNARDEELSALEGFLGARIKSQQEMREMSLQDQAAGFRSTISEAAKHNRAFFMLEKAAAMARALIAARESVVNAYNFGSRLGGPILGAEFAGVAAAAQAVNISAIASTSFGGGGSSVSSGGGGADPASSDGGSGVASNDAAPSKSVYITLNGDDAAFYSKNNVRKLIQTINDAISDGTQLRVAVS